MILPSHQAHVVLLAQFVLSLIQAKSTNLTRVALYFQSRALPESNYKRLQRFLRFVPIDYSLAAKILADWFCPEGPWVLSMDRTNWNFGVVKINFLVLGVAHKGFAIPLFWILLPKQGNSNTEERIDIIDRFLKVFGVKKIQCLTADREFVGQRWFKYLKENNIPFAIRIAKNVKTWTNQRRELPVYRLFGGLALGEESVLRKPRQVFGVMVNIVCVMGLKERVIIACTVEKKEAIDFYRLRWSIETLFGCLKSKGFDLEATHLKDLERLSKLFFVLAITSAWCLQMGIWKNDLKPIIIKKHGRKAKSLIRYGLDGLHEIISRKVESQDGFHVALRVLSCT